MSEATTKYEKRGKCLAHSSLALKCIEFGAVPRQSATLRMLHEKYSTHVSQGECNYLYAKVKRT